MDEMGTLAGPGSLAFFAGPLALVIIGLGSLIVLAPGSVPGMAPAS